MSAIEPDKRPSKVEAAAHLLTNVAKYRQMKSDEFKI